MTTEVPVDEDVPELRTADIEAVGVVMAVMGAKGGCGTTTVATNLAASLASERRTCLVDLDLCKGDVAGFLDLSGDRSVNLVLERLDDLDDVLLRGAMEVHDSGLHVLPQPYDLTELHHVTADEVRELLRHVVSSYELTVVDVGSRIDVASLTALLAADEIVLITTPDVPSLRDALRVLRLLRRLDVPHKRVRLVVNKHNGGVPDAEIGRQLGIEVAATIKRDEDACTKADTAGRLLRDVAPSSRVSDDLEVLWARLHGQRPKRTARMPWWWSET